MELKNKKILVVDDEVEQVEIIKRYLERESYSVVTAQDGSEVLERTRREKPDLIIMDVMMSQMDGYAACSELSKDDSTRHIPIILLTGQRQEVQDIKRGMDAGAVSYVQKPFKVETLLGLVKGFLG